MKDLILVEAKTNFRFVLMAQMLVLALGVLKAILLPVILPVEDFAYWQIYVFYIAYLGLFTLGFNDGIYLRYGGLEYTALPLARIRSSIHLYLLFLIVLTLGLLWVCSFEPNQNKKIVLYCVSLNVVVIGMQAVFLFALQATGQLKQYSFLNSVDKLGFLVIMVLLCVADTGSFMYFVAAELFLKVVALCCMVASCPGLLCGKNAGFRSSWHEVRRNIGSGTKLMFANLSGMLVLGVGRIIIEYFGDLKSYAYYAFAISLTNLALVTITAASIVVYPMLKRLPTASYAEYYDDANKKLFLFSVIALMAYFPVVELVTRWIPEYSPAVPYLNWLFGITVLQGKMQLLNNSYYKALRREGAMLRGNFESLVVVLIFSFCSYYVSLSVMWVAISTFLTMGYQVFRSELYLRRVMGSNGSGIMAREVAGLAIFVYFTTAFDFITAFAVLSVVLFGYLVYAKRDLISLVRFALRGH